MRSFTTAKGTELPLLNLRGKEYLEVKYRIVWFREDHPTWSIETELVAITDRSATARAAVRDDQGRVIATSHKFENAAGFPDFLEKAETGAIGRALALIGYGTQFCADELDEGERIVDSPVVTAAGLNAVTNIGQVKKVEAKPPVIGAKASGDPGDFVIRFGKKFMGKRVRDVPENDLFSYVEWLEQSAAKKNEPVSHEVSALKAAAHGFYTPQTGS
jgi:hypothetical protein